MKTALLAVVLLGVVGASLAACPNHCSGRGKCLADDKCACYQRFTGPDCSQRLCKENIAWVDGTQASPHAYAECSNKGICDRELGECVCHDGFDGAACQRMKCPNDCSGHGTCEYITELGTYASSNWDATKVQGCNCDGGWEGYDCSLRMCPRGDDPLTSHTGVGDIHTITMAEDSGVLAGRGVFIVKDLYGTYETSRPFDLEDDEEAEAALLDMDVIVELADTTPVVSADSGDYVTYTIKLKSPAHVDFIVVEAKGCDDAGCYPKRDPTGTVVGTASNSYTEDSNALVGGVSYLEAAVCSNRGVCDQETGICQCFEGHTGLACEVQSILV